MITPLFQGLFHNGDLEESNILWMCEHSIWLTQMPLVRLHLRPIPLGKREKGAYENAKKLYSNAPK
jgi:hypothetical protein